MRSKIVCKRKYHLTIDKSINKICLVEEKSVDVLSLKGSEVVIFYFCLTCAKPSNLDVFYFLRTDRSSGTIRNLKTDLNWP